MVVFFSIDPIRSFFVGCCWIRSLIIPYILDVLHKSFALHEFLDALPYINDTIWFYNQ